MRINRSSVWGKLWLICVCVQDVTTRWWVQRKIITGFFITVFCLFTKSCEECMFKPFSCYILTVVWHLSNHPLVTVRKGCQLWFHSCIWSESNKTNLYVKIPYLLTFNTQLLFQSISRTGGFPGGTHPKNRNVLAKDGTHLESCQGKLNSCSLTL